MITYRVRDYQTGARLPGLPSADLRLIARLRHYRACSHPACQERASAAAEMRRKIAEDLREQKRNRKREEEECNAAGEVGRNYR